MDAYAPFARVREFHIAVDGPRADLPVGTIPEGLRDGRKAMMREEIEELCEALDSGDPAKIAHELADVLYLVYGTAVAYGLDGCVPEIFAESHRSQMSRLDADGRPILRGDGKILKSDRYAAPDMRRVLDEYVARRRAGG